MADWRNDEETRFFTHRAGSRYMVPVYWRTYLSRIGGSEKLVSFDRQLKSCLCLTLVQIFFAWPVLADESTVLTDLKQSHPGWVKYGHFYGPKYGQLLEYRVVPRESHRHFRFPDGFTMRSPSEITACGVPQAPGPGSLATHYHETHKSCALN
jgi:hypothetical protein